MNIATRIDERLWEFISSNYEKRNYTGSILDSIYYLSNIIRDKSELESDGVALIGQAFGGKPPKLRVSKLQTESDWNVQHGIEQILRGIFQAIRNPRSHEKYNDNQEEADALICFINYLLKIIDQSKSQYSIQQIIQKVYDKDFVESEEYASLIVNEIPVKKRYSTLIDVYNARGTEFEISKLKYFFKEIIKNLKDEERTSFLNFISDELSLSDDYSTISLTTTICQDYWEQINKAVRLRIENKFIKALSNSKFFRDKGYYNNEGAFFTWITNILGKFSLKSKLSEELQNFFCVSDEARIEFFIEYGFSILKRLEPEPDFILELEVMSKLDSGDKRFFNLINNSKGKWRDSFEDNLKKFVEKESVNDDLPF